MDNYETYYKKLMGMKKADIIREGQTWDIWANCQSTASYLMKWKNRFLRVFLLAVYAVQKIGATKPQNGPGALALTNSTKKEKSSLQNVRDML